MGAIVIKARAKVYLLMFEIVMEVYEVSSNKLSFPLLETIHLKTLSISEYQPHYAYRT